MNPSKVDRRVERTKLALINALMELVAEKGYYAVTVQEIADRANIGRTTFYAHFGSKEALMLSAHYADVGNLVPEAFNRDDLLAEAAPESLVRLFDLMFQTRPFFFELLHGADMTVFQREVRARYAERMENSLRSAFTEERSQIPLPMLANYLASSQIGFVFWWVECRAPYNAREMAQAYQRIQRAVLRDAFSLP